MRLSLPGLRPENLLTYLAGLGLVRVVAAQFDSSVTCWWQGSGLHLSLTREGLQDFLIDEYRPTPILSPWNGGSGYGEKDKAPRVALDKILKSGSARLSSFVATDDVIRTLPESDRKDKGRLLQLLRNRVPDEALPWLDAAVVLTNDPVKGERRPVFPPLLGTGGNDGRFDFSTNFHQRLAEVLPDLGAKRQQSARWLAAALDGTPVALTSSTIGQFDPLGAGGPGVSAFEDTGSFVNPWLFVLMMEGLVNFASSPVRRLGETRSRAAMPFTVLASAAGPTPGSDMEGARGELWAPLWSKPLGARDVRNLFVSARTSWDGLTATGAAHMYAALRSCGIDRRADRFLRFGFVERNGLAYSAVLLDTVDVESRPDVELGIKVEDRLQAYEHAEQTNRIAPVQRAYELARVGFYRDPSADVLLRFLAASTHVERAVLLTQAGRDAAAFARPRLSAENAFPLLAARFASSPELRIAAGLASGSLRLDDRWWSMADLLVGRAPSRPGEKAMPARVAGFGSRPLVRVLADLMLWRAGHRDQGAAPTSAGTSLMDGYTLSVPWRDVHEWLLAPGSERQSRDAVVQDALMSMMALDWRKRVDHRAWAPREATPSPALAVLHPFARRQVTVTERDDDASLRGLAPDWPVLLLSGQQQVVLDRAVQVLNRGRVIAYGPGGSREFLLPTTGVAVPRPAPDGTRLAAALWIPTNHSAALRRVAQFTSTTTTEEISS